MELKVDPNSPEPAGLFGSRHISVPQLAEGEDTGKPIMGELNLCMTTILDNQNQFMIGSTVMAVT